MNIQEIISKINSNPQSAKEVLDNMYHGKAFVVARYNGHVDTVKKTKRGAEGYINRQQRVSYYDEMTFEMVTCGSDLEVFEIHESDIKDYKTSLVMWFEYLRGIQGAPYMYDQALRLVDYLEVYEEVKAYVIQAIDDMKNNRGLTIIEEETTQEEVLEVVETVEVIESNPTDITLQVVMNDEKNGIELYFNSKPSQNITRTLKENGFRFHGKKLCWFAKNTKERLSLVEGIQSILTETNQLVAEVIAETEELMQEEATQPTYEVVNTDKTVVLKEIEFVWSESGEIEDGLKVTTFAEAETIIRNAAKHAPDNGAYDKTRFNIVWSDGQNYEGRIDLVRSDMFKATPLKSHIESFVNDVIEDDGTWYSNERKEDYKHFINTYPLEDAKTPINEPVSNSKQSNVLDFTSRIKAKQEQKEADNMVNHFLENVLPYMTRDEQMQLTSAYQSKNEKEVEATFNKILLSTAFKRAKEEVSSKNKL